MNISLIVARTLNHIIGNNNQMPWHLPIDLAWFRQNTIGKPVIMGRKTYESIGRLLPKRPNIILSNSSLSIEGAILAHHLTEAFTIAQNLSKYSEIMVIGGGNLFQQALPYANRLYLTEIQAHLEGDVYFTFNQNEWYKIYQHQSEVDNKNNYACHFMIWERKSR